MGSCVIHPVARNGHKSLLFSELGKIFDRNKLVEWWGYGNNPALADVIDNYKVDSNGEPTLYTMLFHAGMYADVKDGKIELYLNNQLNLASGRLSYKEAALKAVLFNKENEFKGKYFAKPVKTENGSFIVTTFKHNNSPAAIKEMKDLAFNTNLNIRLRSYMDLYGVDELALEDLEEKLQVKGVTEFKVANEAAHGIVALIRLANNKGGEESLGEEYAHFAVAAMADTLLKQRILDTIGNSEVLEEIFEEQYLLYYDLYNGDMDKMAEEALGKLIHMTFLLSEDPSYLGIPVFNRFVQRLKESLSEMDDEELLKQVDEALKEVKELGVRIYQNKEALSVDNIDFPNKLFALSADLEELRKLLLETVIDLESKRLAASKMRSLKYLKRIEKQLDSLNDYLSGDTEDDLNTGPLLGFLELSKFALGNMNYVFKELQDLKLLPINSREDILLISKRVQDANALITAYINMTADLMTFLDVREPSTNPDVENIVQNTLKNLKTLASLLMRLKTAVNLVATPAIMAFIKEFVGDGIIISSGAEKYRGKWTAEDIMKLLDRDITFADRFIDSLGNSSDMLLLVADLAIKKEKFNSLLEANDISKTINGLYETLKKSGIKDLSFMYEVDKDGNLTGNFILRDSELFNKNIKNNRAKLAYYNGMMKIFEDAKKMLPYAYLNSELAPQVSKELFQRMKSKGLAGMWQSIKDGFQVTDKDTDTGFRNVLTDVNGNKIKTVPIFYTSKINSLDLSTDAASSILAYYAMANNFDHMNKLANILETLKSTLAYERKVVSRDGSDRILNRVLNGKESLISEAWINSKSYQKLTDLMDSLVYGLKKRDEGSVKMFSWEMPLSKVGDFINRWNSLTTTALSPLTGLANIQLNIVLIRLESLAKQFFNSKDLLKADGIFLSHLGNIMGEVGSNNKLDKLSLFDEQFNVLQDLSYGISDKKFRKTRIGRLMNTGALYLCTSAGDFYTLNRVALALALNEILKDKNGKFINLWDALETYQVDPNNPDFGHKLRLKEGVTKADGTAYTKDDMVKFANRVRGLLNRLFGIYNELDKSVLHQYALGRMVFFYRDWMRALWLSRWGRGKQDFDLGVNTEGYFMTSSRFAIQLGKEIISMQFGFMEQWHKMTDYERSNIKKGLREVGLYMILCALAGMAAGIPDKKKKDHWYLAMINYAILRLKSDIGAEVPSLNLLNDNSKVMENPFASYSIIKNTLALHKLVFPSTWGDEVESGKWKGYNKGVATLLKVTPGVGPTINAINPNEPADVIENNNN